MTPTSKFSYKHKIDVSSINFTSIDNKFVKIAQCTAMSVNLFGGGLECDTESIPDILTGRDKPKWHKLSGMTDPWYTLIPAVLNLTSSIGWQSTTPKYNITRATILPFTVDQLEPTIGVELKSRGYEGILLLITEI